MKSWIVALLVRWGLVHPLAKPARKPKAPKRARKPAAVNHAAAVKVELLNAVAEALGRAPTEFNPELPTARIAVNGSLYTIRNTVEALSEFQSRLEKLQTTVKPIGVGGRLLPARPMRFAHNQQDWKKTT